MAELERSREALAASTFVELVDALVSEFDVIDLLTVLTSRCVELLDASAAGILLADPQGRLRVMAASTEAIKLLELFQVQNEQGPCLDCFASGQVVLAADLRREGQWPMFATVSVRAGFPSVSAVPLRLGKRVLGALNLFNTEPGALQPADVKLAQALADVASVAMVQDEVNRAAVLRESRLENALQSRVAIEQAKGMLAQARNTDMDGAFSVLRRYARNNNRRLTDVAHELVGGLLPLAAFL